MQKTDFEMRSRNLKTQIHCAAWLPEEPPRAVVQIAHGISSYIERFTPFAEFLCANGIAVYGNDHLGHGQSVCCEEDRLFFAERFGWEFVLADMRALNTHIHARHPGLPVFLLGHSMGSFLSRCYVIRFHGDISGLLLSGTGQPSPALVNSGIALADAEIRRIGPHGHSDALQNIMFGAYNRGIEPRRTDFDWISRDTEVVDRFLSDPNCGGNVTIGLERDMLGGIALMIRQKNVQRMEKSLPVLFFSGSGDPVGDKGAGVLRAYSSFLRAGMEDVTLKLYSGGRHEMLNEINRAQVCQDVLDWVEIKLK